MSMYLQEKVSYMSNACSISHKQDPHIKMSMQFSQASISHKQVGSTHKNKNEYAILTSKWDSHIKMSMYL